MKMLTGSQSKLLLRFRLGGFGVLVLSVVATVFLAQPILASRLSGGTGNPPYQKLSVYQGIVILAPAAGQSLKIGNYNGTYNAVEIESAGSPALRPNGNVVYVAAQNNNYEGGEIRLLPSSSSYQAWSIDSYTDNRGTVFLNDDLTYARLFTDAEKLRLGQDGDAHVIGRLCFGAGTGPADCANQWVSSSAPGNQDLDQVLTYGNRSQQPIMIGDFGYGVASVIKHNWAGFDPSLNAVSAKSTTPFGPGNGSALYAQNTQGYAGTLVGKVGIIADGAATAFGNDTAVRVAGSVAKSGGAILEVVNQDPVGYAARIHGTLDIAGNGAGAASATENEAVLLVQNTSPVGTTLKVRGSFARVAIIAKAGNASAGDTTYGVYAEMGTASGGATSYAGFFRGHVSATALNVRPYGGSEPWGLRFGSDARLKKTVELQVCQTASDTCYGKYVQTINGSNRATAQYCYDNGSAVDCNNIYSPTASCTGAPTDYPVQRSPSGISYFSAAACSPLVGEHIISGSGIPPYGNAGEYVCVDADFDSSFTTTMQQNISGCQSAAIAGTYDRLAGAILGAPYTQALELR